MHLTKAFKIGDLQAVEIPAELAFTQTDIDLQIERVGEELRIRPAKKSLKGILKKFAKFSPDFMSERRGSQEQCEREKL
ncbi:MAG TPA: type II toxin-antitoxin system VapB family antitoxin [Duganella sp.]|uniref:type II toxin-antitoxin system VapB family antitoxin n=1 Tax=Duganella sp. TaxID=1904440 RepID=UPI002ED57C97